MGSFEDYLSKGGLRGHVIRNFQEQLQLAQEDRTHFLAPVLEAKSRGADRKAARLLTNLVIEADSDQSHPLHQFALFAYRLPLLHAELELCIAQLKTNGLDELLVHMDLEQAHKIGSAFIDAEKAHASRKGAKEGGKKGALTKQGSNGIRDAIIRGSKEAVSVLAMRFKVTPTRIRQIKKRPRA